MSSTLTSAPDAASSSAADEYASEPFSEYVPTPAGSPPARLHTASLASAEDDDYMSPNDTFEQEHDEAPAALEEYGEAMGEEEVVESAPDATVPPAGLLQLQQEQQRRMQQAQPPAAVVAAVPAAAASLSKPAAPRSSSSLPSLPSIGLMSSSLTPAGRAHFAQQSSLFGKQSPAAATSNPSRAASASTSAAASAAAPASPISAAALRSYAASNRLCASHQLGIHSLLVPPPGAEPTAASTLLLDGGALRVWVGSMELPAAMPTSAASGASAGPDAFSALSGVFLRAAIQPAQGSATAASADAQPFLHVSIDPSDPLASAASSSAAQRTPMVNEDGSPHAEVHSCFHTKRLGPYRLRVIARGSSMPTQPDSFNEFVQRAQRIAEMPESTGADTAADAMPSREASAMDIQPRVTLYVAVEKLLSEEDEAKQEGGAPPEPPLSPRSASVSVLPLLPLNTPHTFWLSSHLPSPSSGNADDAAPGPAVCSLLFVPPDSASSSSLTRVEHQQQDHFELSLSMTPLHARILGELDVCEIDLDADASANSGGRSKGSSKQARKNAKKRRAKKAEQLQEAAAEGNVQRSSVAAEPSYGDLVTVSISAAPASDASDPTLLSISILPSAPVSPPSLIDLLATLAASPSSSLPSSILDAHADMSQLSAIGLRPGSGLEAKAAAQQPDANASLPQLGAACSATAQARPSPSPEDLLLSSLRRRTAWPFSVCVDAMRVSDESEGHASLDDASALDLLHNRPVPRAGSAHGGAARTLLVGDHTVELLRTVGLLCAWERPRDTSDLQRPVLVSQQPLLSYHVQVRITRLDADEAQARVMDAVLDF